MSRLLIDLSWNSSRLEGNTYSLLDTKRLIDLGQQADGKDQLKAQMILNHKAAIELLVESAEEIGVNRYTITNLHALLADNLLEDSRNAGRLRTTSVAIGGTTYLPTAIPQLIEELFTLSDDDTRRLFLASLLAAADDASSPVRVVLSMRADFLDRLAGHKQFLSELARGLFFLSAPDKDNLRETIVRPAELAGWLRHRNFDLASDESVEAYARPLLGPRKSVYRFSELFRIAQVRAL